MSLPTNGVPPGVACGPNTFPLTSQPGGTTDNQNLPKPSGPSLLTRFTHSFHRHQLNSDPNAELTWALDKSLKSYHSQLIALGSAIGTGLFIGSGEGLAVAGPIPLLVAFSFVGITLCPTVFALGEMATLFPLPGGFFEHCRMYTDEAWGGAMGWKFVLTLPITFNCSLNTATSFNG